MCLDLLAFPSNQFRPAANPWRTLSGPVDGDHFSQYTVGIEDLGQVNYLMRLTNVILMQFSGASDDALVDPLECLSFWSAS